MVFQALLHPCFLDMHIGEAALYHVGKGAVLAGRELLCRLPLPFPHTVVCVCLSICIFVCVCFTFFPECGKHAFCNICHFNHLLIFFLPIQRPQVLVRIIPPIQVGMGLFPTTVFSSNHSTNHMVPYVLVPSLSPE